MPCYSNAYKTYYPCQYDFRKKKNGDRLLTSLSPCHFATFDELPW